MKDDYLVTYLNDHLAGSVAAIELAQRCLSNNKDSDLGRFLETLTDHLKLERAELRKLIRAMKAFESTAKQLGAWAAEKLGRLKLNNSLLTYSDLSRVIELETLLVALQAQVRLWEVLEAYRADDARFSEFHFAQLRDETGKFLEETIAQHHKAAETAFRRTE